jgi:hypothetical protein
MDQDFKRKIGLLDQESADRILNVTLLIKSEANNRDFRRIARLPPPQREVIAVSSGRFEGHTGFI